MESFSLVTPPTLLEMGIKLTLEITVKQYGRLLAVLNANDDSNRNETVLVKSSLSFIWKTEDLNGNIFGGKHQSMKVFSPMKQQIHQNKFGLYSSLLSFKY